MNKFLSPAPSGGVSLARRCKASAVALTLGVGMLASAVVPAAAQVYSVGHASSQQYQAHDAGGGVAPPTDTTADVPAIDYSNIVGEVKSNSISTLLAVAAVGIGISAMFGAFKWISGFLARKSAGSKA